MKSLKGWSIVGLVLLFLVISCVVIYSLNETLLGSVRIFIRYTARSSVILFSLSFLTSALYQKWPNQTTMWLMQNRKYLGISFAVSHLLHGIAIITFYNLNSNDFYLATTKLSFIFGGFGYICLLMLSLTSFDFYKTKIPKKKWQLLHLFCSYSIWAVFFLSFLKRAVQLSFYYWIPVVLMVGMLYLRLILKNHNRGLVSAIK
ncbi:MAG: hypothetical protein ACK4VO_09800 [Pseudobdellovibrio sp.]